MGDITGKPRPHFMELKAMANLDLRKPKCDICEDKGFLL